MPYPPEHKVQTRARIVESARRLFNRHGFEQVTIDQIMASAGLTRGAFYHHFDSKDELYAAAVASFVTCNPFAVKTAHAAQAIDDPQRLARMLVDLYLSDEVLENVDLHCPLYALPSDVARAGRDAPAPPRVRSRSAGRRRRAATRPARPPPRPRRRAAPPR